MAPIALPSGQSAVTELQIEPVPVRKQAAPAEIAEREEDLVARAALDVSERYTQRARGVFRAHAERQRRIVRQGRGESRRVGAAGGRQALRTGGSHRCAG